MATSSSSALEVSDEGYSWFLSDSQPKHLTASCPAHPHHSTCFQQSSQHVPTANTCEDAEARIRGPAQGHCSDARPHQFTERSLAECWRMREGVSQATTARASFLVIL